MARTYVGTSGFNYKHWANGVFYPKGLPQKSWLKFYSEHFNTVELNVSFYRLPKKETFESWRKQTPDDFCFVVKGSRFITHIKRLDVGMDSVDLFYKAAEGLNEKLSVVLWQFGANFKLNDQNKKRLTNFLKLLLKNRLAKNIRHAFEFRHRSWFEEETYKSLGKNKAALVIAESGGRWPSEEVVTADFVYLRFHEKAYSSNYSVEDLKQWARKIKKWRKSGDVYVYFNNDANAYAVKNAKTIRKLL